jgi:hypothetical protein
MVRQVVFGASLDFVTAVAAPGASSTTSHGKVGPHQTFSGAVNGSSGTLGLAMIKVVCSAPSEHADTGHPLSGQSVEVSLAISTASNPGDSGCDATSIAAFFGAPPPASPPTSRSVAVAVEYANVVGTSAR